MHEVKLAMEGFGISIPSFTLQNFWVQFPEGSRCMTFPVHTKNPTCPNVGKFGSCRTLSMHRMEGGYGRGTSAKDIHLNAQGSARRVLLRCTCPMREVTTGASRLAETHIRPQCAVT